MFKKLNKKGFTLAELLVVVAIIGVLVAISIPIFTAQLEKARDAVTASNVRAAYAEAQTAWLTGTNVGNATIDGENVTVTNVPVKGTIDGGFANNEFDFPFNYSAVVDNLGNGNANKNLVFQYTAGSDGQPTLTTVN